MHAYEIQLK